jgi:hypothetical protein
MVSLCLFDPVIEPTGLGIRFNLLVPLLLEPRRKRRQILGRQLGHGFFYFLDIHDFSFRSRYPNFVVAYKLQCQANGPFAKPFTTCVIAQD